MSAVLVSLLQTMRVSMRSRAALHLEILALRHQLQVGPTTTTPATTPPHASRPPAVDLAVEDLDAVAIRRHHRSAGDRRDGASSRLPHLVDMEEPSPSGATDGVA